MRVIKGDTRSLDYSSYVSAEHPLLYSPKGAKGWGAGGEFLSHLLGSLIKGLLENWKEKEH